MTYIKNIKNN